MAKQYFAVNEIRHGNPDGELVVFAPGQQVKGLDKDTMIALWEAGVLTEVDPDAVPRDHRDDEIARLQAELDALKAEKAQTELAAPAVPAPGGPTTTVEPPTEPIPEGSGSTSEGGSGSESEEPSA